MTTGGLTRTSLGHLLDAERLPSGVSYVLRPDTIENGLKVAEASDALKWREKALQVLAVTASIGGVDVKDNGGVEFICGLLDTDVVFLAHAWTLGANGRTLKLNGGVPCPSCAEPFREIDLSGLVMMARETPASGLDAIHKLEFEPSLVSKLPTSLQDGQILMKDPTWREARSKVPPSSSGNSDVVDTYRALSALMVKHGDKPPRAVTSMESRQFPMKMAQALIEQMNLLIPNFSREFQFNCPKCGLEVDIPFDRAGI